MIIAIPIPYLVLRVQHGGPIQMPTYIQSCRGMEQYAALLANTLQVDVGLVASKGVTIWFAARRLNS